VSIFPLHVPMQPRSLHVFHDHQDLIPDAKSRSERGDTWMLQGGDDFDFAQKALNQIPTRIDVRQQDLQASVRSERRLRTLKTFPIPPRPKMIW
jgi:hypothetical protein